MPPRLMITVRDISGLTGQRRKLSVSHIRTEGCDESLRQRSAVVGQQIMDEDFDRPDKPSRCFDRTIIGV